MEHQAVKKDNGKPQLNLVPLEILEPLARVREFAVKKYGIDGIEAWREISDDRLLAALLRHTVAYQKDPNALDQESGLPAIYHVAINAAFLAIKTAEQGLMEDVEVPKQFVFNEINNYDDLPPECQKAVRTLLKQQNYELAKQFGRFDEDWSEGK